MNKNNVSSRFLTIGFTSAHDAAFLNRIAQAGSDLGNFFYVNTERDDYPDQIKECLQSSLSMAQTEDGLALNVSSHCMELNQKIILSKTLAVVDDEEETKVEEVKVQQLKYDFTTQTLFKEKAIEDLKGVIMLP